jgi:hypothetical protein
MLAFHVRLGVGQAQAYPTQIASHAAAQMLILIGATLEHLLAAATLRTLMRLRCSVAGCPKLA